MTRREELRSASEALREVGSRARVYVSMPIIDGITPRVLVDSPGPVVEDAHGLPRKDGIFRLDEVGLSPMDHVALYGDGVFEGMLIRNRSIFLYREHMDRLDASMEKVSVALPISRYDLTERLLETCRAVDLGDGPGYIRLVVTRGMGDLGINPRKCVTPTIFAIVSTIRLYAPEAYERGIRLGLSRQMRRPDRAILDPNIKSNNYLNNVLALIEGTADQGLAEALMLTHSGYVAEATVDNIFSVRKYPGWEHDPSKVEVRTPSSEYCLVGITRGTVMELAEKRGYKVIVRDDLLPIDLVGPEKECFMTGTGAGVMPITAIEAVTVGNGAPGPVTRQLVEDINALMDDPANGLGLDTPSEELAAIIDDVQTAID